MTRLPPKKDVALALLEQATVLVHLDPRGEQVQVPAWFKKQPQLVLQIGLNMPKPIPDLNVDDDGISCTLSFSNTPYFCQLPWSSVYALIGASGRGMVWPDDVPKEVAGQYVVTTPKEEKPRTALRAVGAAPEPSPDEQAAKADAKKKKRARKAKEAKETEKAARATRPKKKPEVVAEAAPEKSRTPRAAAAPAPAMAAAPGTPARRASGGAGSTGAKKKRELPPYLRVVK